jgi:glycosyltransferase involved in cell wall biosynthesis
MPGATCDHRAVPAGSTRVVIVHDYLTQRGGAERVVLDLLKAFPGARVVTSCWNRETTFPDFADVDVETLWPGRVGVFRRDPRRAFPVLAGAFSRHLVDDADVVVCSSSGWAHRVRSTAPKVVYCHNPARWLYQPDDYLATVPVPVRRLFSSATGPLRRSDLAAARSAAAYVVNSATVAARVRAAYGIDAVVVPPARGLSPDGPRSAPGRIEPGFWLTVSRARGYKHTAAACAAVAGQPGERLVVVGGVPPGSWPASVLPVGDVSDAQLRWLYAHAAGLVAVAHEDFGLTPAEAQSFGIPVVALRAGGYLDTTIDGVTGVFVATASAGDIADGMRRVRARSWDAAAIRAAGERYSPAAFATRMREVVGAVAAG